MIKKDKKKKDASSVSLSATALGELVPSQQHRARMSQPKGNKCKTQAVVG